MSIHSPKPHDGPTALWSADNPLCFLSARMAETNVPPPARLQVHHILSLFLFLFFFYRHSKDGGRCSDFLMGEGSGRAAMLTVSKSRSRQ